MGTKNPRGTVIYYLSIISRTFEIEKNNFIY